VLGTPPFGSPQANGNDGTIAFPPAPGTNQGVNHLSTFSSISLPQNLAIYTAPIFINMLYIIKVYYN